MPAANLVRIGEPRVRLRDAVCEATAIRRDEIARVEISVDPIDALQWLSAQPWPDHFFWSGRDDGWTVAAAGIADLIEAEDLEALERTLIPRLASAATGVRYFGSIRFRPEACPTEEWEAFGRVRFVLPRIELRVQAGNARLTVNIMPGETAEQIQAELDRIEWEPDPIAEGLPDIAQRVDRPSKPAWCDAVDAALGKIRTPDLDKVVLARRTSFLFDEPLDPFVLLNAMRASTRNCFHALIGLGQGTANRMAFLTATPERLFRMENGDVASEAIAGTRLRSRDEAQDRLLRNELLHSEKDNREQAFVLSAVRSALEPLTSRLEVEEHPSAFNLTNGRHLRSLLTGKLKAGISAFDLLRSLHPTPAVGGTPRAAALGFIEEHEPFDRGLYAGPIGWIGRDAAEFAVGIRSGLVVGNHFHLYSGAGIVEGSEAEVEWAEIEHKLDDFSEALGLLE